MKRAVPNAEVQVVSSDTATLNGRAQVAAAVAAAHADAVDRDARFPAEAFAAIREQRLLSMLVPVELGGDGATVSDAADVCCMPGSACASVRDDLCDAPDSGRDPRAPRAVERMASAAPAPPVPMSSSCLPHPRPKTRPVASSARVRARWSRTARACRSPRTPR